MKVPHSSLRGRFSIDHFKWKSNEISIRRYINAPCHFSAANNISHPINFYQAPTNLLRRPAIYIYICQSNRRTERGVSNAKQYQSAARFILISIFVKRLFIISSAFFTAYPPKMPSYLHMARQPMARGQTTHLSIISQSTAFQFAVSATSHFTEVAIFQTRRIPQMVNNGENESIMAVYFALIEWC